MNGEYVGRAVTNGEPGLEFALRISSDIGVLVFGMNELAVINVDPADDGGRLGVIG